MKFAFTDMQGRSDAPTQDTPPATRRLPSFDATRAADAAVVAPALPPAIAAFAAFARGLVSAAPQSDRAARRRASRVLTLLAAIIALSVLDLALTMTHAATVGMAEANPIARAIIAAGNPTTLAAWKIASLLPIATLCVCYRRRLAAELCAWLGLAALLVVAFHWAEYTSHIEIIKNAPVAIDHSVDHRWVVLGSAR